MTPPRPDQFSSEDAERLKRFAGLLERVDGWCKINRWIGKFILVGGIGLLILFSNALDAVKNLIGWKH
jgi:hypothetical protein